MKRFFGVLYAVVLVAVGLTAAFLAIRHGVAAFYAAPDWLDKIMAAGIALGETVGAWVLITLLGIATARPIFAGVINKLRNVLMSLWSCVLVVSVVASVYLLDLDWNSRLDGFKMVGILAAIAFIYALVLKGIGTLLPDHRRPVSDGAGFCTE